MWQIAWMLSLLPNWFYHGVLIVGLLGLLASQFLKMIPFVNSYASAIRMTGIVLTVIGIWFNGSMSADAKWRQRVADLEAKIAQAEKQAAEANAKIEYVYVDRVKVVTETKYVVRDKISKNANDLNQMCVITPPAVEILNDAARKPQAGPKK